MVADWVTEGTPSQRRQFLAVNRLTDHPPSENAVERGNRAVLNKYMTQGLQLLLAQTAVCSGSDNMWCCVTATPDADEYRVRDFQGEE